MFHRYSAPELLRGELVPVSELQMCDIYSMGLIVYEIWSECESFSHLNQLQLIEHVGRRGLTPTLEEIGDEPQKVSSIFCVFVKLQEKREGF